MKTKYLAFSVALILGFILFVPKAEAVVPPPDGGYPGFNTAEGQNALFSLTTGSANTAVGWFSLFSSAEGSFNTGTGAGTLLFNTADENTAFGAAALLFNTTGFNNTAVGAAALVNNTLGNGNTAIGDRALFNNTEGTSNTAMGTGALFFNSDGNINTALGRSALFSNTEGNSNTAIGGFALHETTTGANNTANGLNALFSNTTGSNNTAIGEAALENSNGSANTAIGEGALFSNTTGSSNTALGFLAGFNVATADNVICIGAGVSGEDVSGGCYIGNIFSVTSSGGTAVFINGEDKLGTVTSSKRFKENIKPIDKASEALYALKPVAFRYKKEIDPAGTSQLGLVAEDVENVNADLVIRDKEGKPYSVRYDQVNAMLLNEFLKEHRKNEEQEATIARLQKQIEGLNAGLQKVSAQLAVSKPAPHTVNNNQ